jgi:hypothetical protein
MRQGNENACGGWLAAHHGRASFRRRSPAIICGRRYRTVPYQYGTVQYKPSASETTASHVLFILLSPRSLRLTRIRKDSVDV